MKKTTLSENEVKVLMYMKDLKPHRESPQGMDADVFGVVCEMLEERKFVKRIKEDGPSFELYEPRIYRITVKGYEFIMALEQEAEKTEEEAQQKEKEEEKKLDSIITDEELSMLFAEVLKKHPYFQNVSWSTTYWDKTKSYLERLVFNEHSPMAVYKLANELSIDTSRSYYWQGHGNVNEGDRNAYRLYVVIYYKYKDNSSYRFMSDAFAPETGVLGTNGRLEETNKLLDAVRKKYGVVQQDGSTGNEEAFRQQLAETKTLLENANEKIERLEAENKELRDRLEKSDSDASHETETIEIPRQKIRIAMLNLLFEKLGCDTKWITENRKASAVARVYAAIMGVNNTKRIKDDVGAVTYAKRPPELEGEIEEVNSLLQDINSEWKIDL